MSTRPELLTGRWLLAHLLVAAVAAGLAGLGVWQLQRLGEVRATQARIDRGLAAEPVPLERLATPAGPQAGGVDRLEYRRVRVTGTYVTSEQVLQRSRTHEDRPGSHVLTPLRTGEGRAVLVRRGWVPVRDGRPEGAADDAAPPTGRVTVTGWLERSDDQPGFGPRDPAGGELDTVFHADVTRLDRQTDASLYPMVLHLQSQEPPQPGDLPIPAGPPELDSGRHLSYAIQWFSFAVIGVAAYAVFARRRVRAEGDGGDPGRESTVPPAADADTPLSTTGPDR